MATSSARRVQKHRDALRAQGLKPVQLWVYDTKAPGFAEECRRQALAAAEADRKDPELAEFIEAALAEMLNHLDRAE